MTQAKRTARPRRRRPKMEEIATMLMVPDENDPALVALCMFPEHQRRALLALAIGARKLEAAALAGVSDRMIRNWMKEPEFAEGRRVVGRWITDRQLRAVILAGNGTSD